MSADWNISELDRETAERLLELASANALMPDGLESFALLVNGLNAPESWRKRVRATAAIHMKIVADRNVAAAPEIASIGRALALVKESEPQPD
jgi:hypothetical protein